MTGQCWPWHRRVAGGVLKLPESNSGPHVAALELHVTFGAGGRMLAYWMLDDGIFVAIVEVGSA